MKFLHYKHSCRSHIHWYLYIGTNRIVNNESYFLTNHTCTIMGNIVHLITKFTTTNSTTIIGIWWTIFCHIITWTIIYWKEEQNIFSQFQTHQQNKTILTTWIYKLNTKWKLISSIAGTKAKLRILLSFFRCCTDGLLN